MTTAANLITRGRAFLMDSDSAAYRHTDADLLVFLAMAINEYHRDVVDTRSSASALITTAASGVVTFSASTAGGAGLNKTDVHQILNAYWDGVPVIPTSIDELETEDGTYTNFDWEAQTGTPEWFTQQTTGPTGLRLYPQPSASGTLKIWYTAIPAQITASASTVDIPFAFEDAPMYLMVSMAFGREIDSPGGNNYLEYSKKYRMEYERLVAIARDETSWGSNRSQQVIIRNQHL